MAIIKREEAKKGIEECRSDRYMEKAFANTYVECVQHSSADWQLFMNLYTIREQLFLEVPKTEAGLRAIKREIYKYNKELMELKHSLENRGMIGGRR